MQQQEANAGAASALSVRLANVERRLWITTIALMLAVSAAVGAIMVAASDADPIASRAIAQPAPTGIPRIERLIGGAPPILRASGLIIVDENGEERMVLEIDNRGEAVFTVNDAQGKKTFQAPEVAEASLQ